MKIFELMSEARRNQSQNNEKMGHSAAAKFLASIPQDELINYGVTLTRHNKLGLNPKSEYNTPLAICFYPAGYYLQKKSADEPMEYVDDSPFVQVIKLSGNVVNFAEEPDIHAWGVDLLYGHAATIANVVKRTEQDVVSNIERYNELSEHEAKISTSAGKFWYILYALAFVYSDTSSRSYDIAQRAPVVWNKILRIIGIDVVIDSGSGILHENEPWQGMAFNPTAVTAVKVFPSTASSIPKGDQFVNPIMRLASLPVDTDNPSEYVMAVNTFVVSHAGNLNANHKILKQIAIKLDTCFTISPSLLTVLSYTALKKISEIYYANGHEFRKKLLTNWFIETWYGNTTIKTTEKMLQKYASQGTPVPTYMKSTLLGVLTPYFNLYHLISDYLPQDIVDSIYRLRKLADEIK